MKNKFHLLFNVLFLSCLFSCSSNKLNPESDYISQFTIVEDLSTSSNASNDLLKNEEWNSIIKKDLPGGAKINSISVYPKEKTNTILVNYTHKNQQGINSYFETFNNKKNTSTKTKIECIGACGTLKQKVPCSEVYDDVNNKIYCDCQSDNCSMEIKTF